MLLPIYPLLPSLGGRVGTHERVVGFEELEDLPHVLALAVGRKPFEVQDVQLELVQLLEGLEPSQQPPLTRLTKLAIGGHQLAVWCYGFHFY